MSLNERVIFEAALEITSPQARQAFLEKACEGNAELHARVAALLSSSAAAGSFLEVAVPEQLQFQASTDNTVLGRSARDDDEGEALSADLSFLQPSTKPESIGVLGHYEILQLLGQGGFGLVFKAFDEKLHRLVAIKVLNPQMAATSPPRKRFLREARSAAAIRHENIVQVYSVEEQPLPFLVMEYIDGETLQQKLDGQGPLDPAEVLQLGRQIASGLAAAHAQGLIHRDIKPGNILLERGAAARVKITDFGLARAADDASLTHSGTISGTPLYMAPEQALGHTLDHRTDLFSLGSVMYQMVSGRPPFRAPTTMAVLRRVTEDTPRALQEIVPEVPEWLVAVINRLLEKQPEQRFQTASEVADLLARCQQHLQQPESCPLPTEVSALLPAANTPSAQQPAQALLSAVGRAREFVGTMVLMLIVNAGVVWWAHELTGVSARMIHIWISGAAVLVSVLGSLAEYLCKRHGALRAAQALTSIIASACLLAAGNGIVARMQPRPETRTATAAEPSTEAAAGATSDTSSPAPLRDHSEAPTAQTDQSVPASETTDGWQGWPQNAPAPAIAPFTAEQAQQYQAAWAKYLNVPVEYSNALGMKFRLIPPGEFLMGSTPQELEAALQALPPDVPNSKWQDNVRSEAPRHRVVLAQPVYLGVCEVRQQDYQAIVGSNPSWLSPGGAGKHLTAGMNTSVLPVESLTWTEATAYARRLNAGEGLLRTENPDTAISRDVADYGYRLPTEAEWEFACRAGTMTRFWNGDSDDALAQVAWFQATSGDLTHPCGLLPANPFGLCDMHGNVWEWTRQPWSLQDYEAFAGQITVDAQSSGAEEVEAVIRGGCFRFGAVFCRSAHRNSSNQPHGNIGLRLALSVDAVRWKLDQTEIVGLD